MSDSRPVGDTQLPDEPGEVTNEPDNARADDASQVSEPEDGGGE